MSAPIKRLLSGGGIVVLGIGYALIGGNDKEVDELILVGKTVSERQYIVDTEYANAAVGQELRTKRTAYTKEFKAEDGKRSMGIFRGKKHYLDAETGIYKEYDLSVKDITEEAKDDTSRTHDQYVDPGDDAPKTSWFTDAPWDYTFIDSSGNHSLKYTALFNTALVDIRMEYNKFNTEEFITLDYAGDGNTFSWKLSSTADYELQGNEVIFTDIDDKFVFRITEPWAKDAAGKNIDIAVSLTGDTLTYALTIPGDAVYPIVIDPSSSAVTAADTDATTGSLRGDSAVNYAGARDKTASDAVDATTIIVGQQTTGGNFYVWRNLLRFDTNYLNTHVTIDSITYRAQMTADNSALGNYWLKLVAVNDSVNTSYLNATHYNEFEGWAAGSSAYVPTLVSDSLDAEFYVPTDTLAFTFTTAGLSELNLGGTTQFMLVAGRDMASLAPAGNEYINFDDDNSYIQIYYTIPDNVIYGELDGTQYTTLRPLWVDARDTTAADAILDTQIMIGTNIAVGPTYGIYRSDISFELSSAITDNVLSVNSCSLYMWLQSDGSTDDFAISAIPSLKSGVLATGWFNDFTGWAVSNDYSAGINVTYFERSTGFLVSGYNGYAFDADGLDSLATYFGDWLHLKLISGNDIANAGTPANNELVSFYSSAEPGKGPYLKADYTYKSPTGFTMTVIDDDSIGCKWDDIITGEDGYRIIQSPYSGPSDYVDSVGAGIDTLAIGGLTPNTLYTWKVQVIHDDFSTTSDEDTEYTLANLPSLIVAVKSDSVIQVFIDTAGTDNPSTTEYALRDALSGLFLNPVATPAFDTLGRTESWNTLANWGITTCATDCVEVYLRYFKQDGDPDSSVIGNIFNFQINAKTDG